MRPNASWLVLPAYLLATVVLSWPLAGSFGRAIPWGGRLADAPFQAFLLGWDARALREDPAHVFDPPIFHPEKNTLTYMDHMIGETLVASPLLVASPSVAPAYNFLWMLSFVLAAWGTYRLARLFGASRAAAWLAGFLFSFSAYHWLFLDQLNQLQIQCFPFAFEFAVRWLRERQTRHLLALAAIFVTQVWFGWYYAIFLALLLPFVFAWALAFRWVEVRRVPWGTLALVSACVVPLVLPAALPYLRQAKANPEFRRTLEQQVIGSATPLDYLRSHEAATIASRGPLPFATHSLWPGVVTIALAAIGAAESVRRRRWAGAGLFAALAVIAGILSLGPALHFRGQTIGPPLPYRLLFDHVPGFSSMRSAARFGVFVQLSLVIFAAMGWDALRRRGLLGPGTGGRAVAAGIVVLALVTSWPKPTGLMALPTAGTLSPEYAWLARQPGREAMVDVPTSYFEMNESYREVMRQFAALYHGKPRLDGASGYVSPSYRAFRRAMRGFPDERALAAIEAKGGVFVVVHWNDVGLLTRDIVRARVDAEPRLVRVASFGEDEVFRLAPEARAGYSNARGVAAGETARSAAP